jgi:hypothetical protein
MCHSLREDGISSHWSYGHHIMQSYDITSLQALCRREDKGESTVVTVFKQHAVKVE